MRLLIEGGSYSRGGFLLISGQYRTVSSTKKCSTEDWFMKNSLREIDIRSSKKLLRCSRTKPRLSSTIILPRTSERVSTCDRDHTHLIDFAHACSDYSRAASIPFTELQVQLLFEGGYYSGCGFSSSKSGSYPARMRIGKVFGLSASLLPLMPDCHHDIRQISRSWHLSNS